MIHAKQNGKLPGTTLFTTITVGIQMTIEWIVGTAIALLSLIGGVIFRDRQMIKMIHDGDETSREKAKNGDRGLYNKLDCVERELAGLIKSDRDSAREEFVTKGEFKAAIGGMDKRLESMDKKLDKLLDKHLQ